MYSIDHDVLEVLCVLLDEFDLPKISKDDQDLSLEIQNPLLDEILRPLMPPQKDTNPSAYEITKLLLHRAENKLQPYVQVSANFTTLLVLFPAIPGWEG
eukprot:6127519-Pyramimonas_sp.AAC.1